MDSMATLRPLISHLLTGVTVAASLVVSIPAIFFGSLFAGAIPAAIPLPVSVSQDV